MDKTLYHFIQTSVDLMLIIIMSCLQRVVKGLGTLHCGKTGPEDLDAHGSERHAPICRVPPSSELWDWRPL